jgi:hypothetical protein
MRGTTRFQPDPGGRQPVEEFPHLAAPKLTADYRFLVLIDAVYLKDMLGGIHTNPDNRHGRLRWLRCIHPQPGTTDAVGAVHPNIPIAAIGGIECTAGVDVMVTGIERRGCFVECDQFGSFTPVRLNRPLVTYNVTRALEGAMPGLPGARQSSPPAFSPR